jgi:hypothetical protein
MNHRHSPHPHPLLSQIFLESDRDQDNHLNMRELCQGLRSVTEDHITKREMDFVIRVLELADDTVCHQA